MGFWAIPSSQKVQKDHTNISGLKISRNTQYGVNSYLYIMISVRICRQQMLFKENSKWKKRSPVGPQAKPPEAK